MRNFIYCLFFTVFLSCSDKGSISGTPYPVLPESKIDSTPLISIPSYWKFQKDLMVGWPSSGIQLYKTSTPFSGKSMNAYAIIFDPLQNIEFKPVMSTTNKRVSEFYSGEAGTIYACLNGGFFGSNASYSLVMYNRAISSVNIKSLNRTFNGVNTTYYPTRGAFGLTASGKADVSWIYHVGTGNGIVYSYPQPSPNSISTAPQNVPSAGFPSGGTIWDANSAIGGSPVLIENNVINITADEELISVDNAISRARSAIGYTASGKVVLLAVEGNNPSGGAGLNLADLAQLLKDMGCIEALNLDGGGSTTLMVNGRQTIKPSDAAGERPVISAIILKKKI